MIKLAICDDDMIFVEKTRKYIFTIAKEAKKEVWVDTYNEADSVINSLINKKESMDILILDIDMPQMSGLELAEKLCLSCEQLLIIFLSAHEQYVFKAIEYKPFRYIRKIHLEKELPIALQSAFQFIEENNDRFIILKTDDGEERIYLSQILFYELNFKRRVVIYLKNGVKLIASRKTIKEMQEVIASDSFIALHRSLVVNASHVKGIDSSVIKLDDGQKLIISRTRLTEVKQALAKYWGGSL